MRVNTQKALAAFTAHKAARPAASIWTDGTTIFSYATAIVTRLPNGVVILNRTRYSSTTTRQQNSLEAYLAVPFVKVSGLRRNATASDLHSTASLWAAQPVKR